MSTIFEYFEHKTKSLRIKAKFVLSHRLFFNISDILKTETFSKLIVIFVFKFELVVLKGAYSRKEIECQQKRSNVMSS